MQATSGKASEEKLPDCAPLPLAIPHLLRGFCPIGSYFLSSAVFAPPDSTQLFRCDQSDTGALTRAGARILWSHRKEIAMLRDVRNYYGLARDFAPAGYFETEDSEQIVRELKLEIKTG